LVFLGICYDNRDYSFYINVVNPCCIDLLVCWGTNKHIWASVDTAGLFSKKIPFTDSNPTAAYDGLCVQSFFYYDVFLITNQRAISFALTAFFICTFLLIVLDMLILGSLFGPFIVLVLGARTKPKIAFDHQSPLIEHLPISIQGI